MVKEKVARLGVTSLAQAQQVSALLRDNAWPLVREEKLITFSKQGERVSFRE